MAQENSDIPDKKLISNYKKTGDTLEIESLFLRYNHLVYLACKKYLNDAEESKDATMEIFQKLLVDCKKFEISNFPAWLHTVTKNHCLMKIRKAGKLKIHYIPSEEIDSMVMETNDSDDHLYKGDIKWEPLLNNLNDAQKSCIVLFFFDKKSYRQIAEIQGMKINEVKSHIQNGKRNLKNILKNRTDIDHDSR